MSERIDYHGIAALLAGEARRLEGWPPAVRAALHDQAIALAMWELRHKDVLGKLLAALAEASIPALVLKGTALAYDLYPAPATRARGDSDLLVARGHLDLARSILARLGYRRQAAGSAPDDDLALQEVWSLACSAGTTHHIDLHWQLLNAPALRGVLEFADCAADPHPLPRLAPGALMMSRVHTLIHTCVHRAMHLTSPYFVNGITYYGSDRLIWTEDIALLANALSDPEWEEFASTAIDQGVAQVCLDGVETARRLLGAGVPARVLEALGAARAERASAYLLGAGQARRAWQDLLAIPGLRRKLAYVGVRTLPTAGFMRAKYPRLEHLPLALLHVRRMIDLVRPRPRHGDRR